MDGHRTVGYLLLLLGGALLGSACDDGSSDEGQTAAGAAASASTSVDTEGEPADPPFEVEKDCKGLLLVWFDSEGIHTAESRSDIPEDRRRRVRVDSLRLPPDERLGPEWVYVADLREPGDGGEYPVRKVRRAAFDALVDAAASKGGGEGEAGEAVARAPGQPSGNAPPGNADADVVVYGASWCGACDEAASFLRDRGVPFVEKDIEKNPNALAEMQRKATKAGLSPSSIPIIDFRGTIVQGFSPSRLSKLIDEGAQPI